MIGRHKSYLSWMRVRVIFLVIALFRQAGGQTAPVRVSFLQDQAALKDTCEKLIEGGCAESCVTNFQNAVRKYFGEPFQFNLAKFPKSESGFYNFTSTADLVAALPHHPGLTRHSPDFNCMDMVILTVGDCLKTGLKPSQQGIEFVVSYDDAGKTRFGSAQTPTEAFNLGYEEAYRTLSEGYFPPRTRDSRICLTAGLYRISRLPDSATSENAAKAVMETLCSTWSKESVRFPPKFEVVAVHTGDLSNRFVSTDHFGLCFPRTNGFMYVEKSGCGGPFTRLDLAVKVDLTPWLAAAFVYPNPNRLKNKRFATFNTNSIISLDRN